MLDSTALKAAAELGIWCRDKNYTIAVAESCTGGGLGYAISAVAGSSAWFQGGIICYSNAAKQQLLQVPDEMLNEHGAVSAAVAAQLAQHVRLALGADIGVSVTGIAGPSGGSATKPVGLVWFGLATATGVMTFQRRFEGNRHQVRQQAIMDGLQQPLVKVAELQKKINDFISM